MSVNNQSPNASTDSPRRTNLIAGTALVLIGALALAAHYIQMESFGLLFMGTLGLIFLTWSVLVREVGLLIPGSIISSLAVGIYLLESGRFTFAEPANGGVIVLALAAAFGLIALLSKPISGKFHVWALFPAGILGFVGGALFSGDAGLQALEWLGKGWPLALIAFGLYLVLWRKGIQENDAR